LGLGSPFAVQLLYVTDTGPACNTKQVDEVSRKSIDNRGGQGNKSPISISVSIY
jgi:hypothetical protein